MARPPLEWIFSNNVKVLDGFLNDMKLSMVQRQIDALVKAIGGYVTSLTHSNGCQSIFRGAIDLQNSTLGAKPTAPPRPPLPTSVCSFDESATFIEHDPDNETDITRNWLNSYYCENKKCECPKSNQK